MKGPAASRFESEMCSHSYMIQDFGLQPSKFYYINDIV